MLKIILILAVLNLCHGGVVRTPQRMNVLMQSQTLTTFLSQPVSLQCYYWLDSGADFPVTITWKAGSGPEDSIELIKCSGFTKERGECASQQGADEEDETRLSFVYSDMMAVLHILSTNAGDDRNYWCEVDLENDESTNEFGFDSASTVLRIFDSGNGLPKLHTVIVDKSINEASVGSSVTLSCTCEGSHCDDVTWYKGPDNQGSYDMIFTRKSGSRTTPIQFQAYGKWIGKSSLQGDSLKIDNLEVGDSGRYWCQINSAEFYGIGEQASDSSSTTLVVSN